jgi:hypothetical protein
MWRFRDFGPAIVELMLIGEHRGLLRVGAGQFFWPLLAGSPTGLPVGQGPPDPFPSRTWPGGQMTHTQNGRGDRPGAG